MIEEILDLEVDHRFILDDRKTIDDLTLIAAGRKLDFAFHVREKRVIRCGDETNTLIDCEHAFGLKRLLAIKQYGNEYDVTVYEKPDFFQENSRAELLNEHDWLFDTSTVRPTLAEYPYAEGITDEYGNDYTRIQRDERGQHEGDGVYTFLIEYKTDPLVDNDRVLVVEAGTLESPNGGWIEFYEGRLIEPSDVRI